MENEKTDLEQETEEVETAEQESTTEEETVDYQALYEEEKHKNSKLKRKLFTKDESSDSPKGITNRSDEGWKRKMELKVEGYNDEEVDFITRNGGRKALENSYITAAIEAMREKRKAETAMIDTDSSKSPIETKLTAEQFSKLSSTEQLKVLSEVK